MTGLAYDFNNLTIEDAGPILRELNDTKSFVMLPAPLLTLLFQKELSLQAFALYIFIFARANLHNDHMARLRMNDLLTFTKKAPSTVRAYLVELESHGLIERMYRSLGQKTVLIGCRLSFLSHDAEHMIRTTSNRKGRAASQIENETHMHLSKSEENLLTSPDNQRCAPPDNQRLNNNIASVSIKQTTTNPEKFNNSKSDPTTEFVFSIFSINEGNRALKALSNLGYPGKRGLEILEQMAYSFQRGNWNGSRDRAINSMLKLIRLNRWRSPF